MPNRVLVIGEYGTLNGGENSFLAVAPALTKLGWQFHAAVPADSHFASALHASGFETHNLSMHDRDGQRKTQSDTRNEIADMIGVVKPQLIHCNSLSTGRICGPVARGLGVPSLGYLRDILKLSKKAISDLNELDRLIAVSNATRDWHCQQGIEADKTFVVYNGVDSNLFSPAKEPSFAQLTDPVRTELGISTDATVLLFVGQIGMRKGVDTVVDAFLEVAKSVPDVHLLIVGQRNSSKQEAIDYEIRLRNQTDSSAQQQKVHWLGRRTDVPSLMRAATMLVHPARQEPLGRVLLESAASGLPIITTRVGGSPEILAHEEFAGLLIEPNDPMGLCAKIMELMTAPQRLKDLSLALRTMAQMDFSIDSCTGILDFHYRQLLDR